MLCEFHEDTQFDLAQNFCGNRVIWLPLMGDPGGEYRALRGVTPMQPFKRGEAGIGSGCRAAPAFLRGGGGDGDEQAN